jgi:hypothetical protein
MFMPVESTQEIYKKPHLSFTDSAVIAIVSQLNATLIFLMVFPVAAFTEYTQSGNGNFLAYIPL